MERLEMIVDASSTNIVIKNNKYINENHHVF